MIRVQGLFKNYAAFPAVKGISFDVAAGEVVGFLGPNGAGKTTTLRILSGYMPASEGTVEVAGFDVTSASREVRRRTGYLPEDVPLYRDMHVEAYLRYIGGLKDLRGSQLSREVDRVVEATGLLPVRRRILSKCSKGYRQRTGLAQSLLGDPPVLLMDEPTSGLDPNQVVEVRDLIRRLSGEKTVLLSSHILSEVSQICGRVLIISGGELVGAGTPQDLAAGVEGSHRLTVRARGVDPGLYAGVEGVLEVQPIAGDPEARRLGVREPETAAAVARAVLAAGGDLIELRQEGADLEAVFRSLTGGTPHA